MPLHFSLLPERPYFETKFAGIVDDKQMMEYYREVFSRPELQPMRSELVDLSGADLTLVTTAALAELAKMLEQTFRKMGVESTKTAVFSPADMPFGLARVYEAWSESSPELVMVFRDRGEAIDWLCEPA